MRKRSVRGIAIFLAAGFALFLQTAIAQDNSLTNPAAVGVRVQSKIELGLIYDIAITVLETVRGSEAMELLKAADAENKEPSEGFEYILARVKFELSSREGSNRRSFVLGNNPMQWVAISDDLVEYPQVEIKVPEPELTGRVNPGESVEGWVAYAVKKADRKPVMVFDPASGGSIGRGKTLFFKLD
jgi:hypothetical protein